MKLLWLGNSQDVEGYLPAVQLAPHLVAKRLTEALGEHVKVEVRPIWPTERLPALLESWVEESRPDMVLLVVPTFWCCLESVPLKIRRRFGRFGAPISNIGLKVADTAWLSSNRLYYAAQRLALRTVGGATNFQPDEVVERMHECIRTVVRNEEIVLLVQGLHGLDEHYTLARRRPWAEARRESIDRRLSDFCSDLHVTYHSYQTEGAFHSDRALRFGDRMHLTPAGQEAVARDLVPRLIDTWKGHRPGEARQRPDD